MIRLLFKRGVTSTPKSFVLSLALFVLTASCSKPESPSTPPPTKPTPARTAAPAPAPSKPTAARTIAPGVTFREVTLTRGTSSTKLWVYLPEHPDQKKLPCILIAPAGSRMFHGMPLAEGDRPEHLPYVRAGFAVAAYEVAGFLPDRPTVAQAVRAAQEFKDADAGVANAKAALDYLLSNVPEIDPNRIYTAGHSSAATLSVLVAAHEPRVKACVAYAPACDVAGRLSDKVINVLASHIPGEREFLEQSSPDAVASSLRVPVFLFHADDDTNVSTSEITHFADELKKTNSNVTFVRVPQGGHYESMLNEGIPKAIEWLKALG